MPHPASRALKSYASSRGFTSIELVIVIVSIAILTLAIGAGFNRNEVGSVVAKDQLIADMRYVQLKAISMGRPYQITFSGNTYVMSRADNIEIETKTLPNGETVSTNFGGVLLFNTLGEPNFASGNGAIILSGGSTITVFGITGKAE